MAVKNTLTNEKLKDRFDNPFTLVNYAINLAKRRIERGEGIDSNPANDTLEAIAKGEDLLKNDEDDDLDDNEEL